MMIYTSEDIEEIVRNIVSWNTEGLITNRYAPRRLSQNQKWYKKPAVLIDSYTPKNIARYVNIGLDDEERISAPMTKYLLDCGHRKIAFLADNMENVDYIRYTGISGRFGYGLDIDLDNLIVIRPSKYERQGSMEEIYAVAHKFTAFMCCSGLLRSYPDEILQRKGNPLSGRSLHHRI